MTAKKAKVGGKGGASVTVSWNSKNGSMTREYSEAVHGKDYKEYAKEFAEKKNGTIE